MAVRSFSGSGDVVRAAPLPYFHQLHSWVGIVKRSSTNNYQGLLTIGAPGAADPNLTIEFANSARLEYIWETGHTAHGYEASTYNYDVTTWQAVGVTFLNNGTGTVFRAHAYNGTTFFHGYQTSLIGSFGAVDAGPTDWSGLSNAELRLGNYNGSFNYFAGLMAVQAFWRTTLYGLTTAAVIADVDAAFEALFPATKAGLISAGADHVWEFNQPSTSNLVTDAVGTADQFDLVGTTVVTGQDPPSSLFTMTAGAFPSNTVAPVITGSTDIGSTVTCSQGTWSNATSYSYQWRRNGIVIPGATANTHTIVSADESKFISCAVKATGAAGSSVAVAEDIVGTSPNQDRFIRVGSRWVGSDRRIRVSGSWF